MSTETVVIGWLVIGVIILCCIRCIGCTYENCAEGWARDSEGDGDIIDVHIEVGVRS